VAVANDITPKVTEIRFENIGEEVVAKICGSSMWFVYNVSIEGVNGKGKDLQVDVMSSSETEVQTRMPEANVVHEDEVSVRVKTHFQNSKFLPLTKVPAKTTVRIFVFFFYLLFYLPIVLQHILGKMGENGDCDAHSKSWD
jgi:2-methylaconitate cis-trans-isomerase PrpF